MPIQVSFIGEIAHLEGLLDSTEIHTAEQTYSCGSCNLHFGSCMFSEANMGPSYWICRLCEEQGRRARTRGGKVHRPPLIDPDCNLKDLERERRMLLDRLNRNDPMLEIDASELYGRIKSANLRHRCQCFNHDCKFWNGRHCNCGGNPLCLTVFYEYRHTDTPTIPTREPRVSYGHRYTSESETLESEENAESEEDQELAYCETCDREFETPERLQAHNTRMHSFHARGLPRCPYCPSWMIAEVNMAHLRAHITRRHQGMPFGIDAIPSIGNHQLDEEREATHIRLNIELSDSERERCSICNVWMDVEEDDDSNIDTVIGHYARYHDN